MNAVVVASRRSPLSVLPEVLQTVGNEQEPQEPQAAAAAAAAAAAITSTVATTATAAIV